MQMEIEIHPFCGQDLRYIWGFIESLTLLDSSSLTANRAGSRTRTISLFVFGCSVSDSLARNPARLQRES